MREAKARKGLQRHIWKWKRTKTELTLNYAPARSDISHAPQAKRCYHFKNKTHKILQKE
jgi:hypothetical protein